MEIRVEVRVVVFAPRPAGPARRAGRRKRTTPAVGLVGSVGGKTIQTCTSSGHVGVLPHIRKWGLGGCTAFCYVDLQAGVPFAGLHQGPAGLERVGAVTKPSALPACLPPGRSRG